LLSSNTDLFVKDVLAKRMTFVETEVRSDSTITVNQCHLGKEVEVVANALKDKTIRIVKS
jgi:hypothetical protein